MPSAMWVRSAAGAMFEGSMARKIWVILGLEGWIVGDLVGAEAAGEHGPDHVEDEGEAGALPVAYGQGALGDFDGAGVAGEVPFGVVAAIDG